VSPSTSSRPSLAKPSGGSPEFGLPALASRAQDHIAKPTFFPGSLLQKVNSNSKRDFLILVNCVENHTKTGKMQNQFCWILDELYYNFCYLGLS
jgi:hypothetical protein